MSACVVVAIEGKLDGFDIAYIATIIFLLTISSRLINEWTRWTSCYRNKLTTESHLTNVDSLRWHWICELNEVTHCATHGDLYGNVDPSEGHTVLHGTS